MEYRQVYGRKKPANDFVKYFLNWCSREHPETDVLTQSMIDVWCKQRECESNRSFVTRVSAINVFLRYINERSSSQFNLVDNDLELEPLQEPTLFSKEELANFFRATDEINAHEDCRIPLPRFQAKLKALIVPVIFRLMYSTGLRPNEVRWLDCADVDFENGIIHVRKAKGYYQRIIALHPSMVSMLKRYNELMEKEMPGRKVFFPNTHDEYRDIFFITTQFKRCWYKYNQHGDYEENDDQEGSDILFSATQLCCGEHNVMASGRVQSGPKDACTQQEYGTPTPVIYIVLFPSCSTIRRPAGRLRRRVSE